MNRLQRNVVRDILNGIVVIAMIIVISIGFALLVATPAHSAECYECGCTTEYEPINLTGNVL